MSSDPHHDVLDMFVNVVQSLGMVTGLAMTDLARGGALSAKRPVLFDCIATRAEFLEWSGDLFARRLDGTQRTAPAPGGPQRPGAGRCMNPVWAMLIWKSGGPPGPRCCWTDPAQKCCA